MLDPRAQIIFDLNDAMLMICSSEDGTIYLGNSAARDQFGEDLVGKRLADFAGVREAERILGLLNGTAPSQSGFSSFEGHSASSIACRFQVAPFPDDEKDLAVVLLREVAPHLDLGARTSQGRVIGSISEITDRIMHDVRNLIFPLIGHVELAMASVDSNTEAYSSLLDVQSACRICEEDLSRMVDIVEQRALPARFVHPVDLMERSAKVLGYTLPKRVQIEVDVDPATPLVEVSPSDCQQQIVDLAALAQQQRGSFTRVRLGAEQNSSGGVSCEIYIETESAADQKTLQSEIELLRVLLNSLLADSTFSGHAVSDEHSLTFSLEVPPESVSHATLTTGDNSDQKAGKENVVVFHRNELMRDIIVNQLKERGYQVSACSEPETLSRLAVETESPMALFVDCDPGDDECMQTVRRVLETHSPAVVVLAAKNDDRELPGNVRLMPRSYRLDSIPSILRQEFDC